MRGKATGLDEYFEFMLAKETGSSLQEIDDMPEVDYQAWLVILRRKNAIQSKQEGQ